MNGEPYYIPMREGSGAGEIAVDAHYCCDLTASDGKIITGASLNREDSLYVAKIQREEYERYLLLSVKEQLKILIKENLNYFDGGVHNTALRLMAEILIGEKVK